MTPLRRLLTLAGKAARDPRQVLPWLRARVDRVRHARLLARRQGRPFSEFYSEVMAERAARDPKEAVGGLWEEMGTLQLDFLVGRGLMPRHRLLDIGCGSLRAGLHFIRYLDAGNYHGMDISPEILDAGRRFLLESGLEGKAPVLLVNRDLRFAELEGQRFDFLLAQSVFSHMPLDEIEECLSHVRGVMAPGAQFFATYLDGGDRTYQSEDLLDFYHPLCEIVLRAERHGLVAAVVPEYPHPRGQKMLRLT